MAELATDAVRHAPEDAPRALEDALARVGSYAGADAAMLVQYADAASDRRVECIGCDATRSDDGDDRYCRASGPMPSDSSSRWSSPGRSVGALELYRKRPGKEWPTELGYTSRRGGGGDCGRHRAVEGRRRDERGPTADRASRARRRRRRVGLDHLPRAAPAADGHSRERRGRDEASRNLVARHRRGEACDGGRRRRRCARVGNHRADPIDAAQRRARPRRRWTSTLSANRPRRCCSATPQCAACGSTSR